MTMLTRTRKIGFAVALAGFVADQALKLLVTGPLGLIADGQQIVLTSFFNLTRTSNYGISLGLLTADTDAMRWLLVALTGAIALVVAAWITRESKLGDVVPLGLILGGALGNIYDRAVLGHVVDYLDLHFGAWRPFLVFNLADMLISVGVVIILARSLLIREKPQLDTAGQAFSSQLDSTGDSENATNHKTPATEI
ncbi:MAG: signal peptidase II [Novosphingobium sp.]|uniref:signal peptidase II n=1 Tax=Novosphingobium sp. TaxID=1874826 RepID=UPI0032BAF798